MSVERSRLENLEGLAKLRGHRARRGPVGSRAREPMVEHLNRVAALRQGELEPEEATEVEALRAAVESRFAARRGEGGR